MTVRPPTHVSFRHGSNWLDEKNDTLYSGHLVPKFGTAIHMWIRVCIKVSFYRLTQHAIWMQIWTNWVIRSKSRISTYRDISVSRDFTGHTPYIQIVLVSPSKRTHPDTPRHTIQPYTHLFTAECTTQQKSLALGVINQ